MVVGPDGYIYVVIGELQREGQLQNIENGPPPDDSGVIFRIDPEDGSAAPDNPFQDDATNRYFAYGVRNSFGLAFGTNIQSRSVRRKPRTATRFQVL